MYFVLRKVRLKRKHEQAQAVSCFRIWRALRSSQGAAASVATDQRIPRLTIVFLRNERHVFRPPQGALKKKTRAGASGVVFSYLARLKELESLTFGSVDQRSIQLS